MSSQAMIAGLAAYEIGNAAIADCAFMLQLLHFMIAGLPMDRGNAVRLSSRMTWTSAMRALVVSRMHGHLFAWMSVPHEDSTIMGDRCANAQRGKM